MVKQKTTALFSDETSTDGRVIFRQWELLGNYCMITAQVWECRAIITESILAFCCNFTNQGSFQGHTLPRGTSAEPHLSRRSPLRLFVHADTNKTWCPMQSKVLYFRAHVHDSPRQLVFSQTTAWKMGWFQDLAARGDFLTCFLLGPELLCHGLAQD